MIFNSYQYILFLPLVVSAYYLFPMRYRWALLLVASYVFYMAWEPAYALLILTSTVVDYVLARVMGYAKNPRLRKLLLLMSLSTNLGLLAAFKYFELIRTTLNDWMPLWGGALEIPAFDVLLPVGISFYTFQTLGYSIDVYRGDTKPERHFGVFALYVSFFPQLVAGPIERAHRLLPQLKAKYALNYTDAVEGLRLILWGLFKKVAVADRLAVIVNMVYSDPENFSGPLLVLGTVCFAFQIYCDFSAYSDIAIGSARLFGVRLMRNFNRPYHARSIQEFWQRWHISLSTWFRDYVYRSLGGNRCRFSRWVFNILVVFVLSGLWHGAQWTFVIGGGIHAGLYLGESGLRRWGGGWTAQWNSPALLALGQWCFTFFCVNVAWVFFRAESFSEALVILKGMPLGWLDYLNMEGHRMVSVDLNESLRGMVLSFLLLLMVILVEVLWGDLPFDQWLGEVSQPLRWVVYLVLTVLMLSFGLVEEIPFVYFQF